MIRLRQSDDSGRAAWTTTAGPLRRLEARDLSVPNGELGDLIVIDLIDEAS